MFSVTQVLGFYDRNKRYYNKRSAEFGSNVHAATAFWDKGTLDLNSLDGNIVPYLDAWNEFKKVEKLEIIHIEVELSNGLIIGHPDRIVKINDFYYVIDIKTGVLTRLAELQVAAYADLIRVALKINLQGAILVKLDPSLEGHPYRKKLIKKRELKRNLSIFYSLYNAYVFLKEEKIA